MASVANSNSTLNMSKNRDSVAQSHCSSLWSHTVCGEYEPTISTAPPLQFKAPIRLILFAFIAPPASLVNVIVDEKSEKSSSIFSIGSKLEAEDVRSSNAHTD
ncbi:hypothetical protein Bca4012_055828 [Brassica carinata]